MKTPLHIPWLAACVALAAAGAQAQHGVRPAVEAPRVGEMVDLNGALRSVSGIAGNFVAGPAEEQGVAALACGKLGCASATEAAVLATDGKRAVAYLPQSREFVRWDLGGRTGGRVTARERLEWTPLAPGDEVLSMRLTPAGAAIAVRRGGTVWIVSQDGAAIDTLPAEAAGPVLLLDSGAVYARDDSVVVRRGDGSETSFPAPGVGALYSMSPDWVEAAAGDTLFAVRITPGREGLYLLPGGSR